MMKLKRTWVEVDLDNLAHNVATLRKNLPPACKFLGVVKADAYGNGAVPVSLELEKLGANYLAVSNLEEARQLRQGGVSLPILLLGYTPPYLAPYLAEYGVTQEVHCLDYARELSRHLNGATLKVHIKVDTGMSRLGFFAYDRPETVDELTELFSLSGLQVEGMFMHFAVADNPAEDAYTQTQYRRFCDLTVALEERGFSIPILHCCNSGATIAYSQFARDMVRPGIATYGLDPSPELKGMADLKPLMGFKTTVAAIRPFAAGVSVSYGRTYTTPSERVIAVCPVGYADGLNRRLSGQVHFLLHGKKVPVVGRICMDMCMIDITHVPEARVGDTVTLVGVDGAETVTWDDWAEKLGTITYELMCSVNKRVPRIYIRDGQVVEQLRYIL